MSNVVVLRPVGKDGLPEQVTSTPTKRLRLSDARISALTVPAKGASYHYDTDVPGLAIRIMPSGIRSFVSVKKIHGKAQRITLGRWPGLRLGDARRAAARINGEVAAGSNPATDRKAARARAETCNDHWPTYLAHITRKNRAWKRDEERWVRDVAPMLGRKAMASIAAGDCQAVVDALGSKHPVKANRVAALLGAFFGHALKAERIQRNPARGLSRYQECPRDRFLSGEEVQRFLSACEATPQPWCDLFALLLWTGARKSAVMAMRWSDLDLSAGVWRIPASAAKNKQAAAVPLIEAALAILRRRSGFRDGSLWVFPSSSKAGHVAHLAKAWSNLLKSAALPDLRPHDLRRTVGSWLAASGASSFVIQKALTHKSAASAKAYAHLDVEPVRAALDTVTSAMQAGRH